MLRHVLDHGFVALDGLLADDLSVVNAARVSLGKRSELKRVEREREWNGVDYSTVVEYELKQADADLIYYLLKNRHGTPFEHNLFRFHVKCPIFVAREWQRHRIGSFNELSGRYAKLEPEFYVPDPKHVRSQEGKPGEYTFTPADEATASSFTLVLEGKSKEAFHHYEKALEYGVAKEQARLFLPVNVYTQFFWSVNARSLMNFLSLRTAATAMWEIRQYALAVERYFRDAMPHTHGAWVEHGRVAP